MLLRAFWLLFLMIGCNASYAGIFDDEEYDPGELLSLTFFSASGAILGSCDDRECLQRVGTTVLRGIGLRGR